MMRNFSAALRARRVVGGWTSALRVGAGRATPFRSLNGFVVMIVLLALAH
jgi:hypothetical protein